MKPEVIRELNKRDPVPDDIAADIRKQGTITGSRVFGGFIPGESDIDVILLDAGLDWDFGTILQNGHGWYVHGEYYEPEYQAVYVKVPYSKHIHNLLLMRDSRSYVRWIAATEWMKKMKQTMPAMKKFFQDKDRRVEMFEMLKMWEL